MPELKTANLCRITWSFAGEDLQYPASTACYAEIGTATLEDVMDVVFGLTEDELRGVYTSGIVLEEIVLKRGPESTGATFSASPGWAGEQAAESSPPNVATLVRIPSGNISGRYWGRMYWPGVNEGQVQGNGVYEGVHRLDLQSKFTAFWDGMEAASYNIVTLHETLSADLYVTGTTGMFVQQRVATQRRRLRR